MAKVRELPEAAQPRGVLSASRSDRTSPRTGITLSCASSPLARHALAPKPVMSRRVGPGRSRKSAHRPRRFARGRRGMNAFFGIDDMEVKHCCADCGKSRSCTFTIRGRKSKTACGACSCFARRAARGLGCPTPNTEARAAGKDDGNRNLP
jgi:hypothetical protein